MLLIPSGGGPGPKCRFNKMKPIVPIDRSAAILTILVAIGKINDITSKDPPLSRRYMTPSLTPRPPGTIIAKKPMTSESIIDDMTAYISCSSKCRPIPEHIKYAPNPKKIVAIPCKRWRYRSNDGDVAKYLTSRLNVLLIREIIILNAVELYLINNISSIRNPRSIPPDKVNGMELDDRRINAKLKMNDIIIAMNAFISDT
jgi:hypothetical protein